MGKEFLLLMTLERALSLLLSAVLETVNLMRIYIFSFVRLCANKRKLTTKIQNKLVKCKNIVGKMIILKIFSVISQSETEKT
jgi:hypothetical protein